MVGNAYIGRLPNPENDAADLFAVLLRLWVAVMAELAVDRVESTAALHAFARPSADSDVSPVFYAGHGIEMDLLVSTSGASSRLMTLGARRNNLLARSMQPPRVD